MPPALMAAYEKLQRERPSGKLDPFNLPLERREVIRRESGLGIWRLIYVLPNDYKLSVASRENESLAIPYWEICVFNEKGDFADETPLGLSAQDEEASKFINRAIELASWKK
jgi:hypothetical protein